MDYTNRDYTEEREQTQMSGDRLVGSLILEEIIVKSSEELSKVNPLILPVHYTKIKWENEDGRMK